MLAVTNNHVLSKIEVTAVCSENYANRGSDADPGRSEGLPESDAVTLAEVFVAFFPRFVEALQVFGAKFNGEALDIVRIFAPA